MMSQSSAGLFADLLGSPAFKAALEEFVVIESGIRTARLRGLLRADHVAAAHVAEGELTAIEELPGLIQQYAKAYREPAKF